MGVVSAIAFLLRAVPGDRAAIATEYLALRQQRIILQRSVMDIAWLVAWIIVRGVVAGVTFTRPARWLR